MGVFEMVAIVVGVSCAAGVANTALRAKASNQRKGKHHEEFERRIDHIEDRMANIETIVLDLEKHKKFTDLELERHREINQT